MDDLKNAGILVVDDEEVILKMFRRLLKNKGFQNVTTALNANQALKLIKDADTPYAVIFSDQFMPEMSGNELFEKVIALTPDTRRILITGYTDAGTTADAINIGAIHRYIQKPLSNQELLPVLEDELKQHRGAKEKYRLTQITRAQNARLYRFARDASRRARKYKEEILVKKELICLHERELEKMSPFQAGMDTEWGLETFLSRASVLRQETFEDIVQLVSSKVVSLIGTIYREAGITDEDFPVPLQASVEFCAFDESLYPVIDRIIEYACLLTKNRLAQLSMGNDPDIGIDNYTHVPELIDLALEDGYLTEQSYQEAVELVEKLKDKSEIRALQKILVKSGFISRTNFSKTLIKQNLIEIRLNDRVSAAKLMEQGLASEQEINLAFAHQIKKFLETNHSVSIIDILTEAGVIGTEIMVSTRRTAPSQEEIPLFEQSDSLGAKAGQAVQIQVSDDKTLVSIKCKDPGKPISKESILARLEARGIRYGIVDEALLDRFLRNYRAPGKKFVVAKGKSPIPGQDAIIEYTFDADYKQAGIVKDDGTIDFRDRGGVPYVLEGRLLGRKTPLTKGIPGRDVYGEIIPVDDGKDVVLKAGNGTVLSDDGLEIHSAIEGQPKVDSLGTISVFRDLTIDGDVDFETGHIDFKGNVIVSGCVKEGFQVRCADLIANEINGGIIDISGDLNVSTGIINARVKTLGIIQAKFINSSTVISFSDISVMREIMSSEIVTAGRCSNIQGRITASTISAKKGMDLMQVGTERSEKSILRIGIEDYQARLNKDYKLELESLEERISALNIKKQTLERKNFVFHKEIVDLSFEQEQLSREYDQLRKAYLELSDKPAKLVKNRKESKWIKNQIEAMDTRIKETFLKQDSMLTEIESCSSEIKELRNRYSERNLEWGAMKELSDMEDGNPVVKIGKRIMAGSIVKSPFSSLVVKHLTGPCTILEIACGNSDNPEAKRIVIQTS